MKNLNKMKNKIGFIENKYLGIPRPGGHYVFIREIYKNGTCDVNVVTSLEDKNKVVNQKKIKHVKQGNTYALPLFDTTFTRWSGVNKKPIKNVDVTKIQDIGKKKIKRRHNFFIGKYLQ